VLVAVVEEFPFLLAGSLDVPNRPAGIAESTDGDELINEEVSEAVEKD